MKNIKLNYLYRDAGGFEEFGSVEISNATGLNIEEGTALLSPKLISEEFFGPVDWGSRLNA